MRPPFVTHVDCAMVIGADLHDSHAGLVGAEIRRPRLWEWEPVLERQAWGVARTQGGGVFRDPRINW